MRCRRLSGRDQCCAEHCSDSTSAEVSTSGPDDDSLQGPEHADARLRADRSSVAGCNDADLERTAAQSPGTMLQISSRQQTSLKEKEGVRRAGSTREVREQESSTEAKPADSEVQSHVNKDGSAFSRKTAQQEVKKKPHSADDTYRKAKGKEKTEFRIQERPHPAERRARKIQKRGWLPRAMQERSVNNKTHNRSRPQCD